MPGVLLCCLAHQAHRGVPLAGVLLWSSVHQAFDGPASLLFSCRCWHVGREAMVMAPPSTCGSAVSSCFHSCPAFLHKHFPPQSPSSPPLNLCLCSQQQPLPQDHSTLPNPAASLSRGPSSLSRVCMAAARTV